MMKRMKIVLASGAAMLSAVPALAQSTTTIDFSTLADGTAVSTQYAGATFSLTGGPGSSGSPVTNYGALTNSTNGMYPTSAYLTVLFTTTASGITFNYDNFGFGTPGGRGGSSYSAYDTSGTLVSTGYLGATYDASFTNTVVGSGIKNLVFTNGTVGGDSWLFGLTKLQYTSAAAAAVPEPATWGLMILGFGAVGFAMRRRTAVRTTVRYA